jgi:hypothetical protein
LRAQLAHDFQAFRLANEISSAREVAERFGQQRFSQLVASGRCERCCLVLNPGQEKIEGVQSPRQGDRLVSQLDRAFNIPAVERRPCDIPQRDGESYVVVR